MSSVKLLYAVLDMPFDKRQLTNAKLGKKQFLYLKWNNSTLTYIVKPTQNAKPPRPLCEKP